MGWGVYGWEGVIGFGWSGWVLSPCAPPEECPQTDNKPFVIYEDQALQIFCTSYFEMPGSISLCILNGGISFCILNGIKLHTTTIYYTGKHIQMGQFSFISGGREVMTGWE